MAEDDGIKKKKHSQSLATAMRKLNAAEEVYAKIIIQFSTYRQEKL